MKKMMTSSLCAMVLAASLTYGQAKNAPSSLPNISLNGNVLAQHTTAKKGMDVSEIELSFQHYLYPTVKANVFLALHKESSGQRKIELEEGFIAFSDAWGIWFPDSELNPGLGAIVGKKLLDIGKVNPRHFEQLHFIDRPLAIRQFLGGEEGLAAEGGQLSYLLPVDFFSQIQLGFWTAQPHVETAGSHGVEYSGRILNLRLWNSFALSDTEEWQLGVSLLQGNTTDSSAENKQGLIGIDSSYTEELGPEASYTIASEFYEAKYGESGEARAKQSGGFISGKYHPNRHYYVGLRYDYLGKHGDEGSVQQNWSLLLGRKLTETSTFRFQYTRPDKGDATFLAQFVFGMGPHAHGLQ